MGRRLVRNTLAAMAASEMLPTGFLAGRYWLYAIGRANGLTKIGITFRPRTRIADHGDVEWVHLFSSFSDRRSALHAERMSVQAAAAVARRIGRSETFEGLPRDVVISIVRTAIGRVRADVEAATVRADLRLLESLGGAGQVAKLLGYDKRAGGIQRVQNWLSRGIPSKVKLEHPEVFLQGAAVSASPAVERS
jgi:hypothetical protein